MALQEAVRRTRDQRAIDLAGREQLAQRFVGHPGEPHALGEAELDLLDAPRLVRARLIPVHVLQPHPMLVAEPAPHVHGGGVRPFGRADRLALEIRRAFDAGLPVHVERGEAEQARADDRKPDDVRVRAGDLGHEFRERQLGRIPLAVEGEAREDLVVAEREPGEIDALRAHEPRSQVAKMIVVGGGDRQSHGCHLCFRSFASHLPSRSCHPEPDASIWSRDFRGLQPSFTAAPHDVPAGRLGLWSSSRSGSARSSSLRSSARAASESPGFCSPSRFSTASRCCRARSRSASPMPSPCW